MTPRTWACFSTVLVASWAVVRANEPPPTVVLTVTAVGSDGKPAVGLSASDFSASWDGAPATIVGAQRLDVPLALLLLIDNVAATDATTLRAGVASSLKALQQDTPAAKVGFLRDTASASILSDVASLRLPALLPNSRWSFPMSTMAAAETLAGTTDGHRAVIAITGPRSEAAPTDNAWQPLIHSHAQFWNIELTPPALAQNAAQADWDRFLGATAEHTGGQRVVIAPSGFSNRFSATVRLLLNQYAITIAVPGAKPSAEHRIRLTSVRNGVTAWAADRVLR